MPLCARPRSTRPYSALLCVLLGLTGLIAIGRAQSSSFGRLVPLNFGVSLGLDRAYYRVGDRAKVRFLMANDTQRDAHGWHAVRGGNGCEYRLTIEDLAGNAVYRPGSGCLFAETNFPLFAGSTYQREQALPLVYRNAVGDPDAVEGAPLPSGAYRVCFELNYHGPQPFLGSPTIAGTNSRVCVPIQIEQ